MRPHPDSYWQGIAKAYNEAEGSTHIAVEKYIRQFGRVYGPSSARNAIRVARVKGFITPTRIGVATAGPTSAPLKSLADALQLDPAVLQDVLDSLGLRVLSRPGTRPTPKRRRTP